MKHVFIINPNAGKTQKSRETLMKLQVFSQHNPKKIKLFVTERVGHATEIAKEQASKGEPVRIYACGGDGTINEVLQGIIGYDNVEMGVVPIGSGNDFIKNFEKNKFMDFTAQINAPSVPVDIILAKGEFGSRYALNVISLSWDSRVAIEVERFKKLPAIKGSIAYGMSVVSQLVSKKPTHFTIDIDGEIIPNNKYMIGMCANGAYYGGGFKGAPYAKLNDGLLEFVFVNSISRRQVAKLFPIYMKGEHLTDDSGIFKDILTYRQGKELYIVSTGDKIPITIDGEGFYSDFIKCKIVEKAVKLIVVGESPAI